MRMYMHTSTNDQWASRRWAYPAHLLVISSKAKSCQLKVHGHGQTHLWNLCRPQFVTLRYAEKSDLGKWSEMTSLVEHSQCLLINFNIFNDKKYCVARQLQQYIGRKCDFIMLMFLCIFYVDDVFNRWRHQFVNMASCFLQHFRRSSISNVNFFVLTKRWSPILLSKLSQIYAVLEKQIKYIC